MAQGRIRQSVEKSITQAVDSGTLDEKQSAAPIEMLRYMADFLDSDTGDTPATRYVTPASFLSYCDALGLTPCEVVKTKKNNKKSTTEKLSAKYRKRGGID